MAAQGYWREEGVWFFHSEALTTRIFKPVQHPICKTPHTLHRDGVPYQHHRRSSRLNSQDWMDIVNPVVNLLSDHVDTPEVPPRGICPKCTSLVYRSHHRVCPQGRANIECLSIATLVSQVSQNLLKSNEEVKRAMFTVEEVPSPSFLLDVARTLWPAKKCSGVADGECRRFPSLVQRLQEICVLRPVTRMVPRHVPRRGGV